MATVLLLDYTDCDSLTETGNFELRNPVNGPAGADHIIIEVIAPGAPLRPDNVRQTCWDVGNGTGAVERHYAPGEGWTDWTTVGSGGGSGGEAADVTFNEANSDVLLTALVKPTVSAFDTLANLYLNTYGTTMPDNLQGKLDAIAAAAVTALSVTLKGPVTMHSATVDPTVTDDAFAGFADGTMWRNTANGTMFILISGTSQGAAVWKEFTLTA
jgi:hypothetical protein